MKKKYGICPGYVISKNDGQRHFIYSGQLMKLYGVNRNECIILHGQHDIRTRGQDLIRLHPDYTGEYKLPLRAADRVRQLKNT